MQGIAGGGHEAIRPYRNQFRTLASTAAVDADDNAALTGAGVAIYALGVDAGGSFDGAKVADDYGDLCDGSWDATADGDESGADHGGGTAWTGTGSDDDCEEATSSGNSRGLGASTAWYGQLTNAAFALNFASGVSTATRPLYAMSPVFTVATTAPTPQTVPVGWSLIPDGLGDGDSFRLLFVTSGTSDATSGGIAVYNTFVQNAANGAGVDATIRAMSGEFRAVVSTEDVDARDNTVTTGTGVPIHWLDGDQAADDYADFYDDSWDSLQGKTQLGGDLRDVLVWTGSNADGTRDSGNEMGSARPRSGSLYSSSLGPIAHTTAPSNTQSRHIYALSPVLTVVSPRDYDQDDDGLIDVGTLAQLDAIRYDLDGDGAVTDDANTADVDEADAYYNAFPNPVTGMGCPLADHDSDPNTDPQPVCTGYELTANLDFDENGDSSITSADAAYWNGGAGWAPIGDNTNRFAATFEGNGNAISNLFISRGATDYVGLFGAVASGSAVRNLGVADASVTGHDYVGALAASNQGRVSASWASGSVTATDDAVGGLVGWNEGVVVASYSSASVTATGDSTNAGGLVGYNTASASILASYATGPVSGVTQVGGLVGRNAGGAVITASYSTGAVSGSGSSVGGMVAIDNGTVTNSYWDTVRSGLTTSAAGEGKTGAELRAPTGYTGIYANWNLDLDGDSANDNPWDFGADYNNPTLRQAGGKQQGPGPVSGLTAVPSDSTGQSSNLVVTWSAPTDPGDGTLGDPLAGIYVVRHDNDVGDTWRTTIISLETVADFGTTYTISLPEADAYRVEVWAIGAGAAHTEGKRVRIGLPGPPMMGLTSFDRRIDVSWSAHADTGGSAISGYRLQYRLVADPVLVDGVLVWGNWTTLTLPGAATSRSITGLVAGETYEFRLAATNADGTGVYAGPFSALASSVVDYDSDGDGLLEIRTLEQLNAVRWDVDGDGDVTDQTDEPNVDEAAVYAAAFPQAAPNMGCPMSGCTRLRAYGGPRLRRERRRGRGRQRRPHRHRWRRRPGCGRRRRRGRGRRRQH